MDSRSVVVTGGTSGIGKAVVNYFCQKGDDVWALSRSASSYKREAVNHHLVNCDVTDDNSVETAIKQITTEIKELNLNKISIVIHCAGYGIAGSAEDTPIKDAKEQFETNYFGVLRVNKALLPHLREEKNSLVVVLGSIAGRISIPFQSHYASTKFALEAYVEALRIETKQFNIKATIVEAGDTKTSFTNNRALAFPKDSVYLEQGKKSVDKMAHDEQSGYSPTKVAKVIYTLSLKKNPPIRVAVGFSYKLLMFLKRLLPDSLAEFIISKMYLPKS